jgi:hypothetical protein
MKEASPAAALFTVNSDPCRVLCTLWRMDHLTNDELEQYAMGSIPEGWELAGIEEHYIGCDECATRLEASTEFRDAMKAAVSVQKHQRS